jgi:hypothetical protein
LAVFRDGIFLARPRLGDVLGEWAVEKPVFSARLPSVDPIKLAAEFKNPSTSGDCVLRSLLVRVATGSFFPKTGKQVCFHDLA